MNMPIVALSEIMATDSEVHFGILGIFGMQDVAATYHIM